MHHADEAIDIATRICGFIAGPIIEGAKLLLPGSIDHMIESVRGKAIEKLDRVTAMLKLDKACLALPIFEERFIWPAFKMPSTASWATMFITVDDCNIIDDQNTGKEV